MKRTSYAALILIVCLAALVASCRSGATPHLPAARVLFIGNSYTFVNGGIDAQLRGLAPSTATACVTVGGATLASHWRAGTAVAEIRKGGWTAVVLQEQSQAPVLGRLAFDQYVRSFDMEIGLSGARTVLLMTWERPDSVAYGVTTASLAAAYTGIGTELRATVAPAGLAFATSRRERPDIVLYSQDGHPTAEGTYLAACVLFAALFGRSPVGNPFGPALAETRAYLQGVAARTLGY
jgi:hypothetical protein